MTTIELRTSIMADLDKMSVEMLESVSHYVRRLSRRTRSSRQAVSASQKREAAMLFVKNLSVRGSLAVPADEQADYIVTRNKKDFKASTIAVMTPSELFAQID